MDRLLARQIAGESLDMPTEITCVKECGLDEPATRQVLQESKVTDWDVVELLERVEGDRQLMRELLVMFKGDIPGTMQTARMALNMREPRGLARAAHGIKGMLKNLAMGPGSETAGALEEAAEKESLSECEELLRKLEEAVARILLEVETQLAQAES